MIIQKTRKYILWKFLYGSYQKKWCDLHSDMDLYARKQCMTESWLNDKKTLTPMRWKAKESTERNKKIIAPTRTCLERIEHMDSLWS